MACVQAEPIILYFDLETLSPDTPFKNKEGKSLEMAFGPTKVVSSKFHRVAAWIRQIALAYDDKDGKRVEKSWDVEPTIKTWSREAIDYAKLKGFWDLPNAVPLVGIWDEICSFLENAGKEVILLAYNGSLFDFGVLEVHKKRFGLRFPVNVKILTFDPFSWIKKVKKEDTSIGKKLKSLKMEDVYQAYFNKDLPNAHTALGDVKAMMELFPHIIGGKEKWENVVRKEAKPWKIFVTSSLYGLHYKFPRASKPVSLSKEAIEKWEAAGYYTRASIVYAHTQGHKIKSLVGMKNEDREVLEGYILAKLDEMSKNQNRVPRTKSILQNPKTESIPQNPKTESIPQNPKTESILQNNNNKLILPNLKITQTLKNGPKIPGLAKKGIEALDSHFCRPTTIQDLKELADKSRTLEVFFDEFHVILPTTNKKSIKEMWVWLNAN